MWAVADREVHTVVVEMTPVAVAVAVDIRVYSTAALPWLWPVAAVAAVAPVRRVPVALVAPAVEQTLSPVRMVIAH